MTGVQILENQKLEQRIQRERVTLDAINNSLRSNPNEATLRVAEDQEELLNFLTELRELRGQ